MKTKAAVFAALVLLGGLSDAPAGPKVGVVVNPGARHCAPAPICRPVFRSYSTWYAAPTTAFYYWGPSVLVSSSGSGFSTVSPMMNYTDGAPIYRVPPPVLPAQPLTVYPNSTFRWRN